LGQDEKTKDERWQGSNMQIVRCRDVREGCRLIRSALLASDQPRQAFRHQSFEHIFAEWMEARGGV